MSFWNPRRFLSRRRPIQAPRARCAARQLYLERLEDRTAPSVDLLNTVREPVLVVDPLPPVSVPDGVTLPDDAIVITWNGSQSYAIGGEWILHLDGMSGTRDQQMMAAAGLLGGINGIPVTVVRQLGSDGTFLIQAPVNVSAEDLQAALATLPGFVYVEPNFVAWLTAVPDDPDFSELYGLNNTGQTGGIDDADIDAPEAWDLTTGSSSVVVGVIDTGVDYTHPDLAANMWINPGEFGGTSGVDDDGNGYVDDVYGYDFINDDSDPMDGYGHGTHVAGTIGAVGDNALGVVGINWDVQIMALEIFDAGGSTTDAAIIEAINYAAMMRLDGVNLVATNNSWGGYEFSQGILDAIEGNRDAGILFVAAAGNEGINNDIEFAHWPSGYGLDNIISVAASESNDELAFFSNYGLTSVDLAAPGVDILSTIPGGYEVNSGTSMATPHVTGVAALAWSLFPSATYQEIRDALFLGADPVAGLAGYVATGGRLNAFNTLSILDDGLPAPVTVYAADFSDSGGAPDLEGFTIENFDTGLWHLSTGRGAHPGHSSDDSLYFGTGEGPEGFGDYDVGATAGQITSPVIDLTYATAAQLSFNYFLEAEPPTGLFLLFDWAVVQIAADGGPFIDVAYNVDPAASRLSALVDSSGEWQTAFFNLAAFVGSEIQVRFIFDSIDDSFNNYEGWYVDDVTVTAVALDPDVGDTLDDAKIVTLTPTGFTHEEVLGNGPYLDLDVDLYQVTVQANTVLTASTALPPGGTSMDTVLRLFDSAGVELAFNDDFGTGVYSALKYTFSTGGTYYLGVSGFDNSAYDPAFGGSGVSGSTGDYQLNLGIQRILTWDGGGADNNWTTAANWVGDQAPNPGDILIFPDGAARLANTNNFAVGTHFESITFTGGGYTLSGNALVLKAGLINSAGTNIVSTPITLNGPQKFSAAASTTLQVNGTVNNGGNLLTVDTVGTVKLNGKVSGGGGLTKSGAGTLILAGNNTYGGGTMLTKGVLAIGNNNALGTGALTVIAGTLRANGAARTLANPITLAGNLTLGGSLALTLSGAMTLTGNRTITVSNTALTTISGDIDESGGAWKLIKGGAGTLVLSGDNTYTGATVVNAGVLIVNGANATSAVTVKSGATLGGSGSVGKVTVQSGGILSPGSSPAILNTKNVVLNSTSIYSVDLNGTTAGSGHDQINVTGAVNLGGSTLSVSLGFPPAIADFFVIINNNGTDAVTSTFAGLAEGATFTVDGITLQISYVGGTGNDVVLTRVS